MLPGPKGFSIFLLAALEKGWELHPVCPFPFSVITGKAVSQSENLNDTWPQSYTGLILTPFNDHYLEEADRTRKMSEDTLTGHGSCRC